jgi:hypothetical protein
MTLLSVVFAVLGSEGISVISEMDPDFGTGV